VFSAETILKTRFCGSFLPSSTPTTSSFIIWPKRLIYTRRANKKKDDFSEQASKKKIHRQEWCAKKIKNFYSNPDTSIGAKYAAGKASGRGLKS